MTDNTMPSDILRTLKEAGGYVSGEKISRELGLSRAAVWKKIKSLRAMGFVINATPSLGYLFVRSPDLSAEDIMSDINGEFWKSVSLYQKVGSTNELAAGLPVDHPDSGAALIIADRQEKGKGRLGRAWISPPGMNIYMSIVFRPGLPPRNAPLLTVAASLASAIAIRNETGLEIGIKWPNDLVVSGRKLGGILTEVRSDPDKILTSIVGIGINVNSGPSRFPAELRDTATSVKIETGRTFQRGRIISAVMREFEKQYGLLMRAETATVIRAWKNLSATIGRTVRVTMGTEVMIGVAEDIDDEGMLLLRLASGALRRINSGDLTHLRAFSTGPGG